MKEYEFETVAEAIAYINSRNSEEDKKLKAAMEQVETAQFYSSQIKSCCNGLLDY